MRRLNFLAFTIIQWTSFICCFENIKYGYQCSHTLNDPTIRVHRLLMFSIGCKMHENFSHIFKSVCIIRASFISAPFDKGISYGDV